MEYETLVEQLDEKTFSRLDEANRLMNAYRRHIADGLHEALDYEIQRLLYDVLSARRKDLLLTFDHLLQDDPAADDDARAVYGDMLSEANMRAGHHLLSTLRKNGGLEALLQKTVEETVANYSGMDFPAADEKGGAEEALDPDEEEEIDIEEALDPDEDEEIDIEEALGPDEDEEIDVEEALDPDEDEEIDVEEALDPDEDGEMDFEEMIAGAVPLQEFLATIVARICDLVPDADDSDS